MSAMGVIPLRDPARGAPAKAPPPLPSALKGPPPLASMRVPKGTVPHGEAEEVENWDALVAKAKALAAEEDAQADDWDRVIASARARALDEEREWAEAMARAKRIAALEPLEPAISGVSRRPQRPQRPTRPARKPALVPPPAAPSAEAQRSAPVGASVDEEAEWQQMRAQAGLRLQEHRSGTHLRAVTHDVFGAFAPPAALTPPARPRVVAWP